VHRYLLNEHYFCATGVVAHIPEREFDYLLGYARGPQSGIPKTGGDKQVGLKESELIRVRTLTQLDESTVRFN